MANVIEPDISLISHEKLSLNILVWYRRRQKAKPCWNELPQDIFNLVFRELERSSNSCNIIAALRLVSKAWLQAVKQGPWTIRCNARSALTTEKICKALPSMSSLIVSCKRLGTFKLEPLRELSGLTSLCLNGEIFQDTDKYVVEPLVELRYLPSALQSLWLEACFLDPASFGRIDCPQLTRLLVECSQNTDSDIAELLSQLPAVQVQ